MHISTNDFSFMMLQAKLFQKYKRIQTLKTPKHGSHMTTTNQTLHIFNKHIL